MATAVNPQSVSASPFYSQGMQVSGPARWLHVSGQVGVRADGSVPEDVGEQAAVAVANLTAVLAEADMAVADLVKITIYLTSPDHVGPFMGAAAGSLADPPPATTLLVVGALSDPRLHVEIEGVAAAAV